jgi:serine/threonine protein kinase
MSGDAGVGTASEESLVGQAADEFLARVERGEAPAVEEYAARFPQIAQVLRRVLPALAVLRSSARPPQCRGLPPADGGPCAGRLGDYRIIREVDRGGMGVVYEAEQISLGRRVALKVLPFAAAVEPRQLQRFKLEAQAAAHLVHPHIVAVYAVGCESGVHYYAMQFVDGRSLAAVVAELRRPDAPPAREAGGIGCARAGRVDPGGETHSWPDLRTSPAGSTVDPGFIRNAARLGIQAAEALEHAHRQGVLHRDVKPANLLVDGPGHLWVTDFGLARFHRDAGVTQSSDVVGTLRYMSPEQALGPHALVDQRTDVYGLGATLYELLTLRPVHDGRDRAELLRQIERDEPTPPRRHSPAIPSDLETVVLKALASDPADRYATAQELADDLRRFLEDRPIRARRPTPAARLAKWARRHRGLVAATVALGLVALATLAVGTALIWRQMELAKSAHAQADAERRRAQVRYRLARLAAHDIYSDVTQNWLAETEVMRRWLTRQAHRGVERELLQKALEYYRELAANADPDAVLERAVACRRVGEVQQQLGRPLEAEDAYRSAVAQFDGLTSEQPDVPDYGLHLGAAVERLARLLAAYPQRLGDAEKEYGRAVACAVRLADRFPDDPGFPAAQAHAWGGLGELQREAKRLAEAEVSHRRAVELLRPFTAAHGQAPEYHGRLGRALHGLARVRIDQGDLAAARELLEEAVAHQQEALKSSSKHPDYRQAITEDFRELFPVYFRLGEHREAARSAGVLAAILPERACDTSAAVQVLCVCVRLAEREAGGRSPTAQRYIDRARELHREAVRRSGGDPDLQDLLAWHLATTPHAWLRDPAGGVALAERAVAQRPAEGAFWSTLGLTRYRAGDATGSVAALGEATRLNDGGTARDWLYLALAHRMLGHRQAARQWWDRARMGQAGGAVDDAELGRLRLEAALLLAPPACLN